MGRKDAARAPDHSELALRMARRFRGEERRPAILLHGVLRRSGTVYTGELIRLHPDVHAYPHELWEAPFLRGAGHLRSLSDGFFQPHEGNRGKLGDDDLPLLAGSAFLGLLHEGVDPTRTVLVKTPEVEHLAELPVVFPFERALLLLRDGRDLVDSTLRTFPGRWSFEETARRWARAVGDVLDFSVRHAGDPRYWCVRYEDVIARPDAFAREACERMGLDPARYPFDRIPDLPVRGSSSLPVDGAVVWEPQPRPEGFRTTGHWRTWSPERRAAFERIAGEALRAAGYGDDPIEPTRPDARSA